MKIVVNRCFGGFSISKEAAEFMAARGNKRAKIEIEESNEYWYGYGYGYVEDPELTEHGGYDRTDPDLIAAVESLGDKANGRCAKLKVIEIPDGVEYTISDYDGQETVEEKHRSW